MNNPQFHKRLKVMRQVYLAQLPSRVKNIRDAWEYFQGAGNPLDAVIQLRRLVHNLAGSGATFGCSGVSEAAAHLEVLLRIVIEQNGACPGVLAHQIKAHITGVEVSLKQCVDQELRRQHREDPESKDFLVSKTPVANPLIFMLGTDEKLVTPFVLALKERGYLVHAFPQLASFEAAAKESSPAAFFLDTGMFPGKIEGTEFLRNLNEDAVGITPVIFIGKENDFESRLAAIRAGATHYLVQPLEMNSVVVLLDKVTGKKAQKPYRVLIVDDDRALTEMYRAFMERAGMEVSVVGNPLKAMERLAEFQPDLVLMDVIMPGCSGLELASVIRQFDCYQHIPIVFLSSEWHTDKKLAAMNLGGEDYLIKPVAPNYLLTSVSARIARSRVLRQGEVNIQTALRELEDIRFALDQHAIVSVTNSAGDIEFVNDKFCEVSGYKRNELLGMNHRLVKSTMHPPGFYEEMWVTIASGKVWHGEVCNRRKSGEPYWVETTIVPFLDNFGVPSRYISIRTEITKIKEMQSALESSEERLRRSQEYANIGTWDWNVRTGDLYWSERISPLFGEAEGKLETTFENFLNAVHPDDRQFVMNAVNACVEEGREYDIEHRVVWPNGEIRWLQESGDVVRNDAGKPLHMLGVVQDITRRKQAEEEMLQARREAEKANQAKSEFLSRMSHELRTPMNAILGFSQLLESDPTEPLTDSQKENVGHILKAGWHLLDLMNEILDLSRIESGKIHLSMEPVELAEVVTECMLLVEPLAQRQGVVLGELPQVRKKLRVDADRTRLKQILLNLLSNAIKYNREHGSISISYQVSDTGRVRLRVSDTGIGLTESQTRNLFQPFNRLGAEGGEIEGTGIGLVITKRLVELMGGSIGVESQAGIGSTFQIELQEAGGQAVPPAVPLDHELPDHEAHGAKDANGEQRTVLYIEDNPTNIQLLTNIIASRTRYKLITAHNGHLGLEFARIHRPDVIILDIMLPGMDGYEVKKRLCNQEETKDIPVIALSANALAEDIKRGQDAGFFRYLSKPIDINLLLETLSQCEQSAEAQLTVPTVRIAD